MGIRYVRVAVPYRMVHVSVAVRTNGHGVMNVVMVSVIVRVSVHMFQCLVLVFVAVIFHQVNDHTQQHEYAAQP